MTLEQIKELERLEREATPGPWEWNSYMDEFETLSPECLLHPTLEYPYTEHAIVDPTERRNRYFIAAARNALPALLELAKDGQRYREERKNEG